jgi:2-polyprenyl-3-methyl-5-hydroxy-6-metoxy-1,4-benzoquinol methylase
MTDCAENEPAPAFPETADIDSSSDDYATRFAGPTGEWMLRVQERITLNMVKSLPTQSVLDVGGGHGQLAIPLCRAGYPVTVLGSDETCRTRIADVVDSGACSFAVGNVIELPFEDRAFDTVVSFRMLTHCRRWQILVRELCRVARDRVIVDYPTSQGLNVIAPMLFGAKKRLEGNTRHWALFRHAEVRLAFTSQGYVQHRRRGQFFLPMVLHRALRCRTLSVVLEGICGGCGLTRLWGSPVIIEMRRKVDT